MYLGGALLSLERGKGISCERCSGAAQQNDIVIQIITNSDSTIRHDRLPESNSM